MGKFFLVSLVWCLIMSSCCKSTKHYIVISNDNDTTYIDAEAYRICDDDAYFSCDKGYVKDVKKISVIDDNR